MSKQIKVKDLVYFQAIENKDLVMERFTKDGENHFSIMNKTTNDCLIFTTSEYSRGIKLNYFGYASGETIHTENIYLPGYGDCITKIVELVNKYL